MAIGEEVRCSECQGDDLEVVGVRDVHRPARGGESSREDAAVVARRIDFRCRECGCDGSILRRTPASGRP